MHRLFFAGAGEEPTTRKKEDERAESQKKCRWILFRVTDEAALSCTFTPLPPRSTYLTFHRVYSDFLSSYYVYWEGWPIPDAGVARLKNVILMIDRWMIVDEVLAFVLTTSFTNIIYRGSISITVTFQIYLCVVSKVCGIWTTKNINHG